MSIRILEPPLPTPDCGFRGVNSGVYFPPCSSNLSFAFFFAILHIYLQLLFPGKTHFLYSSRLNAKGIYNFFSALFFPALVLSVDVVSNAFCHIPLFFPHNFLMMSRGGVFGVVPEHFLIKAFVSTTPVTCHFAVESTSLHTIPSLWISVCYGFSVRLFCISFLSVYLYPCLPSCLPLLLPTVPCHSPHLLLGVGFGGRGGRGLCVCTQRPLAAIRLPYWVGPATSAVTRPRL